MTKELLNEIENDYWNEKADPIDMTEVFDLANRALEQQPSEDCISREEALRHRHIIYDDDGVGYSVVRVDEIEQLPSVTPQQTCEDCISRTKLLSRIDAERKHLLGLNMDGAEHIIVHHARRIIEDMPSVTPQAESEDKE